LYGGFFQFAVDAPVTESNGRSNPLDKWYLSPKLDDAEFAFADAFVVGNLSFMEKPTRSFSTGYILDLPQ